MLFIGTHSVVTNCRIFIHRWRSCLLQGWRCCGPRFFNLFRIWCIQSRGGLSCWGDYVCIIIELDYKGFQLVCLYFCLIQGCYDVLYPGCLFSLGRNTLREWVRVYQNRHVFCLVSKSLYASLCSEMGSSRFRCSKYCSVPNVLRMTNKSVFLARSNQLGSSMAMVMMSSTNSSIGDSFASMSTTSWSAWNSDTCPGWYSSSLSSYMWDDFSPVTYHNLYLRISLPRSISDFLTVV